MVGGSPSHHRTVLCETFYQILPWNPIYYISIMYYVFFFLCTIQRNNVVKFPFIREAVKKKKTGKLVTSAKK